MSAGPGHHSHYQSERACPGARCRNGLSTANDAYCNDKADKTADLGIQIRGRDQVAAMLANRHKAYAEFMVRLRAYIAKVMVMDREMAEEEKVKSTFAKHSDIQYTDTTKVEMWGSIPDHEIQHFETEQPPKKPRPAKAAIRYKRIREVREFLSTVQFAKAEGRRGITWVELLLAFESVHGTEGWQGSTIEDAPGKVVTKYTIRRMNKPSAMQIVAEFKKIVREVIKEPQCKADPRLFKADEDPKHQFEGLRIIGKQPAIAATVNTDKL